jgi:molecular chaperone GrpE
MSKEQDTEEQQQPTEPTNGNATPNEGAEADTGELLRQIETLQAEIEAAKERHLRSVADLENFRRRVAREKDELRRYGISDFVESLLPALDNLRLGLRSAENHADNPEVANVAQGFRLVGQQMQGAFQEHGVQEIDPVGQPFDPNFHDCVSHQPSESVPENHVSEVMRPGYLLNERLLRPASVVVSSGPPESGGDA